MIFDVLLSGVHRSIVDVIFKENAFLMFLFFVVSKIQCTIYPSLTYNDVLQTISVLLVSIDKESTIVRFENITKYGSGLSDL
jgi:hypothetical protein